MPIEKQLIPLNLSKGAQESIRAELSPTDSLLTVENMVQEAGGAWVKRPGIAVMQYFDQAGRTSRNPRKVFQTAQNAMAYVSSQNVLEGTDSDGAWLYTVGNVAYGTNGLHRGSKFPAWSVTNHQVVSSASTRPEEDGQRVFGAAESTQYRVVAYSGPASSIAGQSTIIAVQEVATGVVLQKYTLENYFTAVTGLNVKMAFSSDRYFHLWAANDIGECNVWVIDPETVNWPNQYLGAPTATASLYVGQLGIVDIEVASGGSIVAYDDVIAVMTDAGALTEHSKLADGWVRIESISHDNNSNLWIIGQNNLAASINVDIWGAAYSLAGLGGAATVAAAFTNTQRDFPGETSYDIAASYQSGLGGVCEVWMVRSVLRALGGSNIPCIDFFRSRFTSVSPLNFGATPHHSVRGWMGISKPFYSLFTNGFFMHACKGDTDEVVAYTPQRLSAHCIISVNDYSVSYAQTATPGASVQQNSSPPVATLEPYTAYRRIGLGSIAENRVSTQLSPRIRYLSNNSGRSFPSVFAKLVGDRASAIVVSRLKAYDEASCNVAHFGEETHVGTGAVQAFDADAVCESGFVDMPIADASVSAGAGVDDGLHQYYVVYRHLNSVGNVTYSRAFGPYAVTTGAGSNIVNVSIQSCGVTARTAPASIGAAPEVTVEVYRTAAGGKTLYLVASSQSPNNTYGTTQWIPCPNTGITNEPLLLSDAMTDATLLSQPRLYRQPLLGPGASVDRFPPPPASHICSHKDRLFVASGDTVYYSSFSIDGESPWYNPQFSFYVPGGGTSGITALASLDGRLVIFKRDTIFVVDGDGPPENGGSGAEFSPPLRLAAEFGCISANSVRNTPLGIIFRSRRGVELLSRKLDVQWIGEQVRATVDAHSKTCGTAFNSVTGEIKMLLASDSSLGTYSGTGVCVVYDTASGAWSTAKYTDGGSAYGAPMQGIAQADVGASFPVGSQTVFIDTQFYSYFESYSLKYDTGVGYWVPITIETAWVKLSGPHERQRIHDAFLLAKQTTGGYHAITISLAYDYSDTYTQSRTWQPGEFTALSLEQFMIQPSQQVNTAIRMKITDAPASDLITYPIGNGKGPEILGIAWQVAPKKPGPQLAAASRA
jgi:hypothetical protein